MRKKEGINLSFLDRFRKKKKEEKPPPPEEKKTTTDLEVICGNDKEVYEALSKTMLLDPRRITESMEETAKKAKEFEDAKDQTQARSWYQIAGGLAIFQGNVAKVKQYFDKCKELAPNMNYKILEIPERAVQKAQEYYQKHLKTEEKK